MGLKIYNSLSNKLEEFIPIHEGKVNMYVCGPTVYNHIHIGNARPVVVYDMLKNYLEFIGYDVTYASNVTDVDDKIINAALRPIIRQRILPYRFPTILKTLPQAKYFPPGMKKRYEQIFMRRYHMPWTVYIQNITEAKDITLI